MFSFLGDVHCALSIAQYKEKVKENNYPGKPAVSIPGGAFHARR